MTVRGRDHLSAVDVVVVQHAPAHRRAVAAQRTRMERAGVDALVAAGRSFGQADALPAPTRERAVVLANTAGVGRTDRKIDEGFVRRIELLIVVCAPAFRLVLGRQATRKETAGGHALERLLRGRASLSIVDATPASRCAVA